MDVTEVESSLAGFLATAAQAHDADALASAAQLGPLAPLGALRVAIYAADPDATHLHLIGLSGGDEVRSIYSALPIDEPSPNAIAFRTGTAMFLTLAETADRFPLFTPATSLYADPDIEFAVLPLRHAGQSVGVLGVVFDAAVPRTWESRAALDGVCAIAGMWCAAHRAALRSRPTQRALTLTERQRAVLRLAAAGLTNGQICAQLGFAESTVKADLTAMYRLTGASTRQELIERTSDLI